jgi:hypothetical protein
MAWFVVYHLSGVQFTPPHNCFRAINPRIHNVNILQMIIAILDLCSDDMSRFQDTRKARSNELRKSKKDEAANQLGYRVV